MTDRAPTRDEAILLVLAEVGAASSSGLASRLGLPQRSVRHRLTRLIDDGYVFAPEYGRYRLTAAGGAVLLPRPPLDREQVNGLLARFLNKQP